MPNIQPLRPGDPTILGPFDVRARLADHDAGVVLLGQDRAGRQAAIAVLHAAAAADPAARDRLEATLSSLAATGLVIDAGPADPLPWVAVHSLPEDLPDKIPPAAIQLLDAAALVSGPVDGPAGPVAGPDFAPHWAGTAEAGSLTPPSASAAPPVAPRSSSEPVPMTEESKRSLVVLGVAILAAVVGIAGIGFAVYKLTGGGESTTASPGSTQTATAPSSEPSSGPSADPSAGPSSGPSAIPSTPGGRPGETPEEEPAQDGPPGPVAGPTYGKNQKKFHMTLRGFPFAFDVPSTWGCMASSKGGPDAVRHVCIDDGGTFPIKPNGSGGIIEMRPCEKPCGEAEWKKARDQLTPAGLKWRKTDSTTMYHEQESTNDKGEPEILISMSHIFSAKPGEKPDKHIAVFIHGKPSEKKVLQKIVNEIRIRTP